MSFIFDSNPIIEAMRRKTVATAKSVARIAALKAAQTARPPVVRRGMDYVIRCLSAKHNGNHAGRR